MGGWDRAKASEADEAMNMETTCIQRSK